MANFTPSRFTSGVRTRFTLCSGRRDKAENLCPRWESKSAYLSYGLATTETELTLFGDREREKMCNVIFL